MKFTTRASIAVSGKLSSEEVSALIVAGAKAQAITGDASGLVFTTSDVTLQEDGSADVELVYVKADTDETKADPDQSGQPDRTLAIPVLTPAAPAASPPGVMIPTA